MKGKSIRNSETGHRISGLGLELHVELADRYIMINIIINRSIKGYTVGKTLSYYRINGIRFKRSKQ